MSALRTRIRLLAAEVDAIGGAGSARRDAWWCTAALIGAWAFALGFAVMVGG